MIHYKKGCLSAALKLLDSLPAGSAELSHCEDESEAAEAAKARGAKRMICVREGGNGEERL